MHTSSEENYLKSICLLSEFGSKKVNTKDLADAVDSKPSSTTTMIQKLSDKNLVKYEKYKGVELTSKGLEVAKNVVRKHRLWETFLVKALNFSWDEVHETAEQLEHVKSPLLMDRLDAFLGFPNRDPHGDPIPDKDGNLRNNKDILLADAKTSSTYKIVRVKDSSNAFLQYLSENNINLDTTVEVMNKYEFDNSMRLKLDMDREVMLSEMQCNSIYVSSETITS